MSNLINILDTTRRDNETWEDVYNRINANGAIDQKTLAKLVFYILDELDKNNDSQ